MIGDEDDGHDNETGHHPLTTNFENVIETETCGWQTLFQRSESHQRTFQHQNLGMKVEKYFQPHPTDWNEFGCDRFNWQSQLKSWVWLDRFLIINWDDLWDETWSSDVSSIVDDSTSTGRVPSLRLRIVSSIYQTWVEVSNVHQWKLSTSKSQDEVKETTWDSLENANWKRTWSSHPPE